MAALLPEPRCCALAQARNHKHFSTAKHFACKPDPSWEGEKEIGNSTLADGGHELACEHYSVAAGIAMGPVGNGSIEEFFAGQEAAPKGSPVWRIAQVLMRCRTRGTGYFPCWCCSSWIQSCPAVDRLALRFLPEGKRPARLLPEPPGRHLLSNRAQALLKTGAAEEALENARRTTKYAPEYVKGHYRVQDLYCIETFM